MESLEGNRGQIVSDKAYLIKLTRAERDSYNLESPEEYLERLLIEEGKP